MVRLSSKEGDVAVIPDYHLIDPITVGRRWGPVLCSR
jgi:hypothetical protein